MTPSDDRERKVDLLLHTCRVILFLSAANMIMNLITICAAFLVAWL